MSKKSRFSEEDLELDEIGQPSSSSHNKKKSSTTGQKKGYNNNKEAGLSTFVESPMQMRDVDIGHGEHRFSNAENERDRYMRERKMSVAVSPAADTEQRAKERQEAEISDREKRPKRKPLSKRVIERIAKWWRFMYHKRGRQRFFCGVTLLDWIRIFLYMIGFYAFVFLFLFLWLELVSQMFGWSLLLPQYWYHWDLCGDHTRC